MELDQTEEGRHEGFLHRPGMGYGVWAAEGKVGGPYVPPDPDHSAVFHRDGRGGQLSMHNLNRGGNGMEWKRRLGYAVDED